MNILTNTGPLLATGVMWSAKVDDISGIDVIVRDIAGSTLTIETSPDNSAWTAIGYGQNVTVAGTPVDVTTGTVTVNGRYWFSTLVAAYIRVRVSTYVGPNPVNVEVDTTVQTQRTVLNLQDVGLTGQGTTQATARPIQAVFNRFSTVAASAGCILPGGLPKNVEVVIRNSGANTLTVYPPVGGTINGGSVNAGASLGTATVFRLISDGANNFWSF